MTADKNWPTILNFGNGATITEAEVEKHYRQVAKTAHPDAGGSNEAMTEVNLAKQLALKWIAKERERVSIPLQHAPIDQQYSRAQQSANAYHQQWNSQANAMNSSPWAGMQGAQQSNYVQPGQSKASWVRDFFRSAKLYK